MSVESRHSAWLAIGGTLFAVGIGGLLTLQGTGQLANYQWVAIGLAITAFIGLYGLLAPILGLPLPATRSRPIWRRERLTSSPRPAEAALWVPTSVTPTDYRQLAPSALAEPTPGASIGVSQRRLLKSTPEDLIGMYDGLTDVEAERLLAPYSGEWIEVCGTVRNVIIRDNLGLGAVYFEDQSQVVCWFHDKEALQRIRFLRKGHQVKVQGQIERVDRWLVSLDPCELID